MKLNAAICHLNWRYCLLLKVLLTLLRTHMGALLGYGNLYRAQRVTTALKSIGGTMAAVMSMRRLTLLLTTLTRCKNASTAIGCTHWLLIIRVKVVSPMPFVKISAPV